ncbi:MAG TPA: uracil-DNA glycosylase, partial [Beijerinckiaceae bacterium]|nr:uracil-DNA glycosylase [Beijerinckiaceae bacterium]
MSAATDLYSPAELAALLRWYAEMGVDLAIDAEPHDRFAEQAALASKPQPTRAEPSPIAPRAPLHPLPSAPSLPSRSAPPRPSLGPTRPVEPIAAVSADAVAQSAREAAAAAKNLDELRAALDAF